MSHLASRCRAVVNITYSFDPNNNTLVNVTATAKINTSFIGLLPAFKTLNVSATAQGKAARVEMTLVLDRSGPWVAMVDRPIFLVSFRTLLEIVSMMEMTVRL